MPKYHFLYRISKYSGARLYRQHIVERIHCSLKCAYAGLPNSTNNEKWGKRVRLPSGYIHIYRLLHKWKFSPKVPRKRFINIASNEEKEVFKKRLRK
ncbi:MAG: winged helix-turn-helix domain-containing protein [Candidatus Nitrosopolaris sp.]